MTLPGTMTGWVRQYLDHRRQLGFQLRVEGSELLRFARWVDADGCRSTITTELALNWATLAHDRTPLYRARRLEAIRGLAKYQSLFNSATEIPPPRLLGSAHRRTTPYIYSTQQVASLVAAAEGLPPAHGLRPLTYSTLFGLLAATGLRISEALKLDKRHADLRRGVLIIDRSKFRQSRLVPLHSTCTQVLRRYACLRDRHCPRTSSPAFFLGQDGEALAYSTVRHVFSRLRAKLGWKPSEGTRAPRIHDLRHTFVCRRVLLWYRQGVDVAHAISALSTYLGHRRVTDTYWYLTGVPELLAVAAQRFEHLGRRKIP